MFAGSRTTPTVDGEHVYTVGPMGDLHAISTKTRKPTWRKNIWKDFNGGAELPRWAIVQNPVIYGDALIVAPQTPEAGVVAYDKLTGALKWKSAALTGIPGYVTALDRQGGRRGSPGHDHCRRGSRSHRQRRQCQWSRSTHWQGAVDLLRLAMHHPGSELFKNPDFGAHTQPPVLHDGHFYSHYTINERSDGLVAMSKDGQIKWKTDQRPPFVRGGSILADGWLIREAA